MVRYYGRKMMVKNEVPFFMVARYCNKCPKNNLLKYYVDIIDQGRYRFRGGASGSYLETIQCCPEVSNCYPFFYREAASNILDSHFWFDDLLTPNEFIEQ